MQKLKSPHPEGLGRVSAAEPRRTHSANADLNRGGACFEDRAHEDLSMSSDGCAGARAPQHEGLGSMEKGQEE